MWSLLINPKLIPKSNFQCTKLKFLDLIYVIIINLPWSIQVNICNETTNLDFSGIRDAMLGTLGVLEAFGSCDFSSGLGELDLTAAGTEGVAAAAEGSARSVFGSFDNLEALENTPCIGLH